jgi:voltage-gated potassium channel Kch
VQRDLDRQGFRGDGELVIPSPCILVIGDTDVGRRVCSALSERSVRTLHLGEPNDSELAAALTPDVEGIAVMLHDDIRALRYSLIAEHLRPGIRLFVAMFDRTVRQQLETTVPNCVVLSPAAISVPTMVASAIAPQFAMIRRQGLATDRSWVSVSTEADEVQPWKVPLNMRLRGLLGTTLGQFRPYDSGSTTLLAGAFGLVVVTAIDTVVGMAHESGLRALYDAARTTATISSPTLPDSAGVLIWATLAAIIVMIFTAMFAAGIVNHLLSGRHVTLVGRRVVPRSGHVIVAGMGQVGLRLAQELRSLGIAVVGIERDDRAPGLGIARASGVPVIIADAASQQVLKRAGAARAIAIVAAGSDERGNIAVSVTAMAGRPGARVVLRAGSDDAIAETTSLFRIGSVIDVNGLTAAFVAESMIGSSPYAVVSTAEGVASVGEGTGSRTALGPAPSRCTCAL